MTTPPPPPPGPDDHFPAPPPFATGGGTGRPPGHGFGIAALVLGICAALLSFLIGLLAAIPAILAIVFGILAIVRLRRQPGARIGMAVTGLVLGCVALILSIVVTYIVYQVKDRCEADIGHPPNSEELAECIQRGV